MKKIVTANQMKKLDQNTIQFHKVPAMVLMERAALAVADQINPKYSHRILVVCGNGNNAGDGIAVARILKLRGYQVDIFQPGEPKQFSEECRKQMDIAKSYEVAWVNNPDMCEYTTIVDALFGVGLCRRIEGVYETAIKQINEADAYVISIDIPSGIHADDGQVMGAAVKANVTVSFAYTKNGHLLRPGADYCGKLVIADIGIYEKQCELDKEVFQLEEQDLTIIPKRTPGGNKGTFGKVLLIAGSREMGGAAYLSGMATLRTGCGMLKIITAAENKDMIHRMMPEALVGTYQSETEAVEAIRLGLDWADVIGIGPGIGLDSCAQILVRTVMEQSELPVVADADALNLISQHMELLEKHRQPCIITPHLGEMSRLSKKSIGELQANVLEHAREFADKYKVQCVLKDSRTCIAVPDGSCFINTNGNSGMASAGSGDVLTGVILGLLAQGTSFEHTGALGAWIHGRAGDLAKNKLGAAYMIAGDLIKQLQYIPIGGEAGEYHEKI